MPRYGSQCYLSRKALLSWIRLSLALFELMIFVWYNIFMGFKYDPFLKMEAVRLRKLGKSYNEIRRSLGVKSKGTLSLWL